MLGAVLWRRRWLFLPCLVTTVPMLVLTKGGDALSVCLNTVAILFLCDIDNIAFDLALGERVRARVEDAGRVELDDAELSALARTKAVHVVLIVLVVSSLMVFGPAGTFLVPFAPRVPARRRGCGVRAGRDVSCGDGPARRQGAAHVQV